ncbi:hypothetical protein [Nitrobacter sp.]|uniref:hypothetical protein n=1 Tax=Nitrobacter sp. TaxID=29420 RepID=UPI0029CAAFBD|nr:hypothetical protein [Nitrobacter sp.]
MTLKRAGESDLPVIGKRVVGGSITEIGNSATEDVFQIRLSTTQLMASSWAIKEPSPDTDLIVANGRTRKVLDAAPLGDSGVVGCWLLTVAG